MLHNDIERKKGYLAAVVFSFIVGFSFLGIKICQRYVSGLSLLCYRYDFAFAAVLVMAALGVVKIDLRSKPKKDLLLTAGFYIGFMTLQVMGLFYATSIEGAVIFAIVPVTVKIIAAVFLGERSTWTENVFIGISVTALIFMIVMGTSSVTMDPAGTVMLIISSLMMALSNIFMRYTRDQYKPEEISFAIVTIGFAVFHIALIIKSMIYGGSLRDYIQPFTVPEVFISGAYLGIGCILLSAQMMSYVLARLEAAKGTIFGNLSAAVSILAGVIVLHEPLRWYHIVCTVLIVTGVLGVSFSGSRGKQRKEG